MVKLATGSVMEPYHTKRDVREAIQLQLLLLLQGLRQERWLFWCTHLILGALFPAMLQGTQKNLKGNEERMRIWTAMPKTDPIWDLNKKLFILAFYQLKRQIPLFHKPDGDLNIVDNPISGASESRTPWTPLQITTCTPWRSLGIICLHTTSQGITQVFRICGCWIQEFLFQQSQITYYY